VDMETANQEELESVGCYVPGYVLLIDMYQEKPPDARPTADRQRTCYMADVMLSRD
jgi:hypothetical protein